ncbi:hypothetical protein AAC387_Pa08g1047 [Persea americana]
MPFLLPMLLLLLLLPLLRVSSRLSRLRKFLQLQAPSPRSIMREGHDRMEISRNVDNIVGAEMERFRAKLLTSPRTKQLYHNILISGVWSDRNQGSLKKPDYVFGDSSDCKERHSTKHITFSFVDTKGETITVSTKHTYRRGSSALVLKLTKTTRDDSYKIAWGTGERTFKTGIFQYNVPGF